MADLRINTERPTNQSSMDELPSSSLSKSDPILTPDERTTQLEELLISLDAQPHIPGDPEDYMSPQQLEHWHRDIGTSNPVYRILMVRQRMTERNDWIRRAESRQQILDKILTRILEDETELNSRAADPTKINYAATTRITLDSVANFSYVPYSMALAMPYPMWPMYSSGPFLRMRRQYQSLETVSTHCLLVGEYNIFVFPDHTIEDARISIADIVDKGHIVTMNNTDTVIQRGQFQSRYTFTYPRRLSDTDHRWTVPITMLAELTSARTNNSPAPALTHAAVPLLHKDEEVISTFTVITRTTEGGIDHFETIIDTVQPVSTSPHTSAMILPFQKRQATAVNDLCTIHYAEIGDITNTHVMSVGNFEVYVMPEDTPLTIISVADLTNNGYAVTFESDRGQIDLHIVEPDGGQIDTHIGTYNTTFGRVKLDEDPTAVCLWTPTIRILQFLTQAHAQYDTDHARLITARTRTREGGTSPIRNVASRLDELPDNVTPTNRNDRNT